MKRRIKNRNQLLTGLALVCLALIAVCIFPALLALVFCAPKAAAGLSLAAIGPFALLKCEDMDGRGGGGEGLMGKVGKALEALDSKTKRLESEVATLKSGGDTTRLKEAINEIGTRVASLSKQRLSGMLGAGERQPGQVSEEAAAELGATYVRLLARTGKLEGLATRASERDALLERAASILGIERRAMSTDEIPLPVHYGSEIRILAAQHGVVRKHMMPYPMSGGVNKPPRSGTLPAFGSIAMSAPFPEKKPTLTFASLESHKIGGMVILPREIDDQSIVAIGQYLAMYGALEFARCEDLWGFLADGSGTYEEVKGVCTIAREGNKSVILANGKTKPSDATLDEFRELRAKVSVGALSDGKYYIHNSWETALRSFNTDAETVFIYRPDGTATLDGFPIVWTNVLQPYSTAAAADKDIALFGSLRWWWLGERGSPRIDTSEHVYFSNDQLATRFIEEIDFDYASLEAMATLATAEA